MCRCLANPIDASGVSEQLERGILTIIPNVNTVTPARIKVARTIAIAADALQIALFPLLSPGFISPLDDALDVIVCITLTSLVGWHYSFLPSFVLKVVPFADMVPSWTLAVFLATRHQSTTQPPIITNVYSEPVIPPQLPEGSRGDKR